MGKLKDSAWTTWEGEIKLGFLRYLHKEIEVWNRPTTHFNRGGWLNIIKN